MLNAVDHLLLFYQWHSLQSINLKQDVVVDVEWFSAISRQTHSSAPRNPKWKQSAAEQQPHSSLKIVLDRTPNRCASYFHSGSGREPFITTTKKKQCHISHFLLRMTQHTFGRIYTGNLTILLLSVRFCFDKCVASQTLNHIHVFWLIRKCSRDTATDSQVSFLRHVHLWHKCVSSMFDWKAKNNMPRARSGSCHIIRAYLWLARCMWVHARATVYDSLSIPTSHFEENAFRRLRPRLLTLCLCLTVMHIRNTHTATCNNNTKWA